MKKLIIFCALIYLSFTESYITASPRSAQSCDNATFGWFWDGQKCEPCANDYCLCGTYNGCTSCKEGFGKVKFANQNSGNEICVSCPNYTFYNDGLNGSSNYANYMYTEMTRINEESNIADGRYTNIIKSCCSPFTKEGQKYIGSSIYQAGKGLRAESCKDDKIDGSVDTNAVYKKYGSICWFIQGCEEYNDPYKSNSVKCKKCFKGYYLDENQYCKKCSKECTTDHNKEDCNPNNLQYNICEECSAWDQCTKCAPGYYLAEIKKEYYDLQNEDTVEKKILKDASWCKRCPQNTMAGCTCELESNGNVKVVSAMPGYEFDDKNNKCETCHTSCSKCHFDQGTKICDECQAGYTDTPNQTKQLCGSCRTHHASCNKCKYDGSWDIQCTSCDNEWYLLKVGGSVKCKECPYMKHNGTDQSSEGRTRCSNSDSSYETEKPKITQCNYQNGGIVSAGYQTKVYGGYHPRSGSVPNNSHYYLYNSDCVKNEKYCQKIKDDKGNCSECYPGYENMELYDGNQVQENKCFTCSAWTATNYSLLDGHAAFEGCAACSKESYTDTNQKSNNYLTCTTCKVEQNATLYGKANAKQNYVQIDGTFNAPRKTGLTFKQCKRCPEGCLKCTMNVNVAKCDTDKCQKGYLYNTDNERCEICHLNNCEECAFVDTTNYQYCKKCFPYYRLWSGPEVSTQINSYEARKLQVCEACEKDCEVCTDNKKQCTQCKEGTYLWEGVCMTKKNHCMTQDDENGKCSVCEYGYRLIDGSCVKCFSHLGGFIHCHEACSTSFDTNIDLNKSKTGPNGTSGGDSGESGGDTPTPTGSASITQFSIITLILLVASLLI